MTNFSPEYIQNLGQVIGETSIHQAPSQTVKAENKRMGHQTEKVENKRMGHMERRGSISGSG